jgi:hypothetical protein
MGKVVKGVLIGGLIGAAVAGMKSLQSDQPSEDAGGEVAKTAVTGAAIGGVLALFLTRRKKKKAKKRLKLGTALTAGGLAEAAVEAARVARPMIEQAAEVARERAAKAAEAARPTLEQAADVARDRASKAAAAAQAKLEDVASSNGDRPILVRLG